MAIMAVAMSQGGLPALMLAAGVISGSLCWALLGIFVFSSYALLFSTQMMNRGYQKCRRGIEGVFALFFTVAGIKLLFSR